MNTLVRIKEKLDEIIILHEELLEDLPSYLEFSSERVLRRGIEKTIELIADSIIDAALMVISLRGLPKPASSRDAIALLEKHGLLGKTLSHSIADLVSFRNLLVHRYGKVDMKEEYENIRECHEDILSFVKSVEKALRNKK